MRAKKLLIGVGALAVALGLLLPAAGAQAATKKAGVVKGQVLSSDKKSLFTVDLDGDGKEEKLSLKTKADEGSGCLTQASLTVDGKAALTFKETQALSMTVDYVQLSAEDMYLRVLLTGANDFRELDCFYRYDADKKRMVKQAELMDSGRSGIALIESVRGMEIRVRYEMQFTEIGTVTWNSVYTPKSGKLKPKSTSASAKCVDHTSPGFDDYGKLFAKNQLKANTSVKLYADTSLKKAAFTAKKGDVLTLKKIRFAKGHFYAQLAKGDKKGWLVLEKTDTPPFYGVMERLAG